MKKVIKLFLGIFIALNINAQVGSKALYDLFPVLPTSMTNDDLKGIITPSKRLDDKSSSQLSSAYIPNAMSEYYIIGKYEVGKLIHLLYGAVNFYDKATNDYAMNVACSSYNTKNDEMIVAGLQNYLCMVGQDALKRESRFSVSGDIITFVMKSTDAKNNTEVETTKYKFSKFLEFISRN
jgi:hypothetical protein